MRAIIQRVSHAEVRVDDQAVASIRRGLVALIGIESEDRPADRAWLADKLINLRVFEDAAGKMNLSLIDLAADPSARDKPGLLLVPNFTVAGDARKGRRPSFDNAMRPELAGPEFTLLVEGTRSAAPSLDVQVGVFRAHMQVALTNDGPVTIHVDSRA